MNNVAEKFTQVPSGIPATEAGTSRATVIEVMSQSFGASVSAAESGAPLSAETACCAEEALGRLIRKRWPLAIKDELAGLSDHELGEVVLAERRLRNLDLQFVFINADGLS